MLTRLAVILVGAFLILQGLTHLGKVGWVVFGILVILLALCDGPLKKAP